MKYLLTLSTLFFGICFGESAADFIKLLPHSSSGRILEDCLAARRSVRDFTSDTLTLQQVSNLFWAAQGITDTNRGLRTAPSAVATYPLEVYLVSGQRVFSYRPKGHELVLLKTGDLHSDFAKACFNQPAVQKAPISIVIATAPERTSAKFGEMAMRFILLEAGHVAQNVLLEAVALGLASVPMCAFSEEQVSKVMGLDMLKEKIVPLYVLPVGVPVQ